MAALSLSALILGGGLFPQLGIATRQRAAEEIVLDRRKRLQLEKPVPYDETALKSVERPTIESKRPQTS